MSDTENHRKKNQKTDRILLDVQGLKTHFSTRYGLVKAVDGVSFNVKKGETVGLVGESGCGKTITSLSILGLVPKPAGKIVGGKILFEGADLVKKSQARMRDIRGARISMILQDPLSSLNPAYTVGNQVGECVELHQHLKGSPLLKKIIEVLRWVRIPAPESRVGDYPHQMSGGMRQRVVGGIAISCQPALIIADEPTTSLDVTVQAQYLKLLKDIQQEFEMSLILVTHDFGIVATMCDRVNVMYAGRIVESAKTRELFNHPHHPYTQALMGCIPRLEKRLETLVTIEGQPPQLFNLPQGCSFHPRCPEGDEGCLKDHPHQRKIGTEHHVSCWHIQEHA